MSPSNITPRSQPLSQTYFAMDSSPSPTTIRTLPRMPVGEIELDSHHGRHRDPYFTAAISLIILNLPSRSPMTKGPPEDFVAPRDLVNYLAVIRDIITPKHNQGQEGGETGCSGINGGTLLHIPPQPRIWYGPSVQRPDRIYVFVEHLQDATLLKSPIPSLPAPPTNSLITMIDCLLAYQAHVQGISLSQPGRFISSPQFRVPRSLALPSAPPFIPLDSPLTELLLYHFPAATTSPSSERLNLTGALTNNNDDRNARSEMIEGRYRAPPASPANEALSRRSAFSQAWGQFLGNTGGYATDNFQCYGVSCGWARTCPMNGPASISANTSHHPSSASTSTPSSSFPPRRASRHSASISAGSGASVGPFLPPLYSQMSPLSNTETRRSSTFSTTSTMSLASPRAPEQVVHMYTPPIGFGMIGEGKKEKEDGLGAIDLGGKDMGPPFSTIASPKFRSLPDPLDVFSPTGSQVVRDSDSAAVFMAMFGWPGDGSHSIERFRNSSIFQHEILQTRGWADMAEQLHLCLTRF